MVERRDQQTEVLVQNVRAEKLRHQKRRSQNYFAPLKLLMVIANCPKVFEIIGVEPEFWKIFSSPSLFEDKEFDDLTFRQKVWLLKTLCDTASV